MRKYFGLVLFSVALVASPAVRAQEGLGEKVLALIEKLASDDINTSSKAQDDLVQLGTPAIDPVKREAEKVNGDLRLKLETVLRKIESATWEKRTLSPVLVTLTADQRPLVDVLNELKKLSGQPLAFTNLPEDRISVSFDRTNFWEALEGICRKHGGVMWTVSSGEILVEKRHYRSYPIAIRGCMAFRLESATTDRHKTLRLGGFLVWTAGTAPFAARLAFEELGDDSGGNLLSDDLKSAAAAMSPMIVKESLAKPFSIYQAVSTDAKAQKISKCKGFISVRFSASRDTRRFLSIASPEEAKGEEHDAGPFSLLITDFKAKDGKVQAVVRTVSEDPSALLAGIGFKLVDDKRGIHVGIQKPIGDLKCEGRKWTLETKLEFALPEGVKPATLNVMGSAEVREIQFPFDFSHTPLELD